MWWRWVGKSRRNRSACCFYHSLLPIECFTWVQASWMYSDHPQNKCQNMKGNARCVSVILSYIDKSIAFVCLIQMVLPCLGSWLQGRCDHSLVKVWIFRHTREMHSTRLLGKQKPAPFWVLCSAVCRDQIPAGWWLPLATAVLECSTCTLASWV